MNLVVCMRYTGNTRVHGVMHYTYLCHTSGDGNRGLETSQVGVSCGQMSDLRSFQGGDPEMRP